MKPRQFVREILSRTGKATSGVVAPATCLMCGSIATECPICDACRAAMVAPDGQVCPRCGLPQGPYANPKRGCDECRGVPLGFDAVLAAGAYAGAFRTLCLKLKHAQGAWLAPTLALVVAEAKAADFAREIAADPEALVVPVPLHWRRHMTRRFNQAELLAGSLAWRLGLPMACLLRRVARTAPLASASRLDRAKRLRGAFVARRAHRLAGRTVFLVDDILTTGATCGSAARALKSAGAKRVVAVVVARTVKT